MNDEAGRQTRPAFANVRLAGPPTLVLRAELEQLVRYGIEAETYEDEQRLLISLQPLPRALRELADDLEQMLGDRKRAA